MKKQLIVSIFLSISLIGCNPNISKKVKKDTHPKVILITLDGLRWQELFTGADSLLVSNKSFVNDTIKLKKAFWRKTTDERRKVLFPFFWSYIKNNGTIYGNRAYKNNMNLSNNYWFSYPGYSEILCGFADNEHINSNDKINNPNTTVLEYINNTKQYKGKVAAFGSWDVFSYIINTKRSTILVNDGFESAKDQNLTSTEIVLNKLQKEIPSPFSGVRLDAFTQNYALEFMKRKHPNLVYISYGETDDFAHQSKYDAYLHAAKRADSFIKELWEFTQKDPFYKNRTSFIITTDHGRGILKEWTSHGKHEESSIKGSNQVWLAAFGAKIKQQGEVKTLQQLYSNQIAVTVAKLMNLKPLPKKMNKTPIPILNR